jgi:hypothetical protein
MKTLNIEAILERLALIMEARNDVHLSTLLGRESNQVSQWKKRKTMDWELVVEKCIEKKCSIDWLLTEKGSKENSNEALIQRQLDWFHKNIESLLRGEPKWKL